MRNCARARKDLVEDCARISTRSSRKDRTWTCHKSNFIRKNITENAAPSRPQDHDETTTHTLCEPARLKSAWTSLKGNFTVEFWSKMPRPKAMIRLRPTLCANLRSRKAHGHDTPAISCDNLQCSRPTPRQPFWANVRVMFSLWIWITPKRIALERAWSLWSSSPYPPPLTLEYFGGKAKQIWRVFCLTTWNINSSTCFVGFQKGWGCVLRMPDFSLDMSTGYT